MKLNESILVKILFASICASVIIALILIILVWKINVFDRNNNEEPSTINEEVGNFNYIEYNADMVLNKYLEIFNNVLYNADIDTLYELLSDDFKEEYSYTKEELFSNLNGKNVLGKSFSDVEYTTSVIEDCRVYAISMVSEDNSITFNFNIIEKYPNEFKFSLDNYILTSNVEENQVINGIELSIREIKYYNDRIVTRAKLTNSNNYSIFVNASNKNENIYYRMETSDGNIDYITDSIVFSGKTIEIQSNSDIELTFDSQISFLDFSYINKLVIKDVRYSENGALTELVYDF